MMNFLMAVLATATFSVYAEGVKAEGTYPSPSCPEGTVAVADDKRGYECIKVDPPKTAHRGSGRVDPEPGVS